MRQPRGVERKGVIYSPTLIQIPMDLKRRLKQCGISISAVCNEALTRKLQEIELMVEHESDTDTIPESHA